MALEKKKTLNVFKEAPRAWGSYDDYPVGPAGTDPMPHLSRNRVAQPFFLVSEEDQVLIQMSGEGEIEFREVEPTRMALVPGDTVYVPAGVPTRLVPRGENVQIRLKAEPPAREAVAWYCTCGSVVHSVQLAQGDRPGRVSPRRHRLQRRCLHSPLRRMRRGAPAGRPRRHRVAGGRSCVA